MTYEIRFEDRVNMGDDYSEICFETNDLEFARELRTDILFKMSRREQEMNEKERLENMTK